MLNFEKKVAYFHPGSVLKSLQKFHGDRMNGLVSYNRHAYIHTYFDFYIYRYKALCFFLEVNAIIFERLLS